MTTKHGYLTPQIQSASDRGGGPIWDVVRRGGEWAAIVRGMGTRPVILAFFVSDREDDARQAVEDARRICAGALDGRAIAALERHGWLLTAAGRTVR